jgi:hypothetical protein
MMWLSLVIMQLPNCCRCKGRERLSVQISMKFIQGEMQAIPSLGSTQSICRGIPTHLELYSVLVCSSRRQSRVQALSPPMYSIVLGQHIWLLTYCI